MRGVGRHPMKTLMDDLLYVWGELIDLRRKIRDKGGPWGAADLAVHERLVSEIDTLVGRLPEGWKAWKEEG